MEINQTDKNVPFLSCGVSENKSLGLIVVFADKIGTVIEKPVNTYVERKKGKKVSGI